MKILFILLVISSLAALSSIHLAAATNNLTLHGSLESSTSTFYRGDVIKFYGWSNAYGDWKQPPGLTQTPGSIFDVQITGPDNKIVFEKSFVADNTGHLEFSLPVTDDFKFGRYSIKTSISKEGYTTFTEEGLKSFSIIRKADDIVTAKEYDVKFWIDEPVIYDTRPTLYATICPSLSDSLVLEGFTDPETGYEAQDSTFLEYFYVTSPTGSGVYYNTEAIRSSDCTKFLGDFWTAEYGTWSAYAVVKWANNGVLYETQSNVTNFVVKEPLFPTSSVKQIVSIDQVSSLNWESSGKSIVFQTYSINGTLSWKVNPDGTGLKQINDAEFQSMRLRAQPNELGSMSVYSTSGYYTGAVYLSSIDGKFEQLLYHFSNGEPFDPVLSPDGRFVAFKAIDSITAKNNGIYLIELNRPVPEFGTITALILIISVLTVVMFGRFSRLNL